MIIRCQQSQATAIGLFIGAVSLVSHYCPPMGFPLNIEYPYTRTNMEYICAYYTCVCVLLLCWLAHWRVREHVAIYFNFLNSHLRRKQSHRLDVTGMLEHMPNSRGRSSNNNCHRSAANFAHQSRNDCGQ